MIDSTQALEHLKALRAEPKAIEMESYHKVHRFYLGVSNSDIDDLVKVWRKNCTLEERVELAAGLWNSDIHEARIAAAKLFVQARIRPDDAVWAEITRWVPMFDAMAIADMVCSAGGRRLVVDLTRLDQVEDWTKNENHWIRRAAFEMTLPLTKLNNPTPQDLAARERVLGWCATLATDQHFHIQKAIGNWLATLSKHDPERVRAFIEDHGDKLKNSARKEATKALK
jgi:3-methyladenine DNA glycosylase AlkD